MVSPPGRQPAKKKRRSAASFSGGGQSLGNGSAASSSGGGRGSRASSGAPTAGGFRNQGNDPNQNPTFPTGSASAAPAASPRDDAAARAERLAAFERRAAAGAQRERLNEFECAICLEAFKGSACPDGPGPRRVPTVRPRDVLRAVRREVPAVSAGLRRVPRDPEALPLMLFLVLVLAVIGG